MLQTLIFVVVYVEFRCCRHVMLGVVSRRRGTPDVSILHATWSQHGSLGCCAGGGGGGSLMLDVTRNMVTI
jgi:hypothetical protein